MSHGPGRMMRAVLAELAERESASAWSVARRAHRDMHVCDPRFPDWWCRDCEGYAPPRSEVVSARRAMHALARSGDYEVYRDIFTATDGTPPNLSVAKRGHYQRLATLRAERNAGALAAAIAEGLVP